MIYLIVIAVAVIGWYLTTSHLAYKDGVRDNLTFNIAWWPCYKASSTQERLARYVKWKEAASKTKNPQEKQAFEHFASITMNYIERSTRGKIKQVN